MVKIVTVILAGGSGTRLWPLSRENYPKQFLRLVGQNSLLQETVLRAQQMDIANEIVIVTSDAHYFLCQDQLAEIGVSGTRFLLEPCARNTAPAIALAAQYIQEHIDPKAVMIVLPSDHFIQNIPVFNATLHQAAEIAEQGLLVTLGVVPTAPKTGYGYIEIAEQDKAIPGCYPVKRFTEKPNQATAEVFLEKGNFYWNSGMFIFQVKTYLDELKKTAENIYEESVLAYRASEPRKDFFRIDQASFALCTSESIDYAVMEKTTKAVVIPLSSSWNDLGCWASVAEAGFSDENQNVIQGNVTAIKTSNSLISTDDRLVTTIGIDNQIIVSTADAVLVADKKYSQEVKEIVQNLKNNANDLAMNHKKMFRPWGYVENLSSGHHYQVKHVMIKPGASLSLQMHEHRTEHWVVLSGKAEVVRGEERFLLNTNQSTYIPPSTKHQLINVGAEPLHVLEVRSGHYLGEDDIVKYDDVHV